MKGIFLFLKAACQLKQAHLPLWNPPPSAASPPGQNHHHLFIKQLPLRRQKQSTCPQPPSLPIRSLLFALLLKV